MSLNFKYIPLTFLKDLDQIKEQVKNTIILSHFFDKNKDEIKLEKLIEGTQYGYNASALEAGKNKFLRISDITDGAVNWSSVPYCDCTDEKTYLLQKHDLLIARTGGTTGKSFLIDNPPISGKYKAIFAGYLIRIRANDKSIPEFLNLFLNSYAYWSQVLSLNKGEFRPSVNATKLKELILPKCSIQEQRDAIKIAKGETINGYEELAKRIRKTLKEFDNCQEVISEYVTQKNLLSQLKQSILQEAIQGKLTADWRTRHPELVSGSHSASELLKRIKDEKAQLIKSKKIKKEKTLPAITKEEIPFDLPEGWVWCRLGEVTQSNAGKTLHKGQNSGIPRDYITTSNLYWNNFKLENVKQILIEDKELERCLATKGDLLICEGGDVGRSAIWNKDYEICFQNHIHRVRPYCDVQNPYLYLLMLRLYMSGEIKSYKKGMGIGNLSGQALKSIIIPLCPLKEQKEIVKKVALLMAHCQKLAQEITKREANAQMLMQAVLKEAFSEKEKQ